MIVVTGGTLNRRVRRVAKFGRKIRRRRSQKGKNPKPNSKSGYVRHGKSFPDPVNFAPALIIQGEHRGTISMAAPRMPEVDR